MPKVSIILPTYNRADVIDRAISSVQSQTYDDWELLVIDDGSTDNTSEVMARHRDPRIRLIQRPNGGCYVARNAGLRLAAGRFITFLDSDDEWLPHYLELAISFLNASPDQHLVMTEFWAESEGGTRVRNDYDLVANRWPKMARLIGSRALELKAGQADPYLRVYESREAIGAWGHECAARAGYPDALLYRGRIFRSYRWGHLGWLPTTIITRKALDTVGLFNENYRAAADYRFLALLCQHFTANMIAVPCAVKHEAGAGGAALAEGHLATGAHEYRYAIARIPLLEELFSVTDPETARILGLYLFYAGRTALQLGKRHEAIDYLSRSCARLPGLLGPRVLHTFALLIPSDRTSSWLYGGWLRVVSLIRALRNGETNLRRVFVKTFQLMLSLFTG